MARIALSILVVLDNNPPLISTPYELNFRKLTKKAFDFSNAFFIYIKL
jgi:hypothetical protein